MRSPKASRYLEKFPEYRSWVNQCAACGREGYRPDMQDVITKKSPYGGELYTAGAEMLRRLYEPLAVNDLGFCETCATAVTTDDSN